MQTILNSTSTKPNGNSFNRWLISLMLILSALALPFAKSYGQSAANYAYSTSTSGSLALDKDGNAVNMTTGTTQLYGAGVDTYTNPGAQNFGFTFTFMGVPYTQWNANPDGQIRLGATLLTGHTSSAASGAAFIIANNIDAITGAAGKVHYKVQAGTGGQVLIIEWKELKLNWSATGTTLSTFQARLYQATGTIEFVYGQMFNSSTSSQSEVIGFSSALTAGTIGQLTTLNVTPTYNTSSTSFTSTSYAASTAMANLNSAVDGSRRVFTFTPPAAPAAPTGLGFTAVTGTTTTLNWTDNASTEAGYAIYRSTDNVSFTLVTTAAANAVTYPATGLNFGTTYYWRVVAINEGGASTNLDGSQATSTGTLSGTKNIGPTGDYASLTAAFAAINANGLAGNVDLALQPTYVSSVETFPIATSAAGASAGFNINIYPTAAGLSITSASASGTFNFTNASKITIDGRVNQTGAKNLVISATNVAGYAINFVNDATNNTVKYCVIKSVNTGTSSGTIVFGSTTGSTGNDGNTIDNNDIYDGATTPLNGIYASGNTTSVPQYNSGNTISNNNIYNFFGAGSASNGVLVSAGNTDWTINANHFYQTATRTGTTSATSTGINISSSTAGNNFVVTNNFIGGSAANAGGTAWTVNGTVNNRFVGIQLSVASTTASSVQGNTIANFNWIGTGTASTMPGVWAGIYLSTGVANIGNVTGNTIGNTSNLGSILIGTGTTGSVSVGIGSASSSAGNISISNNSIGSINVFGITPTFSHSFNAIWNTGSISTGGALTINGNTIGSLTQPNSIQFGTSATGTTAGVVHGILQTGSAALGVTISNNTVANLNNNYLPATASTSSLVKGISATSGSNLIFGNTVRNLSATGATTGTTSSASVIGISMTSTSTTTGVTSIAQNNVYALSNSHATAASSVIGIYVANATSGRNNIERNLVYNLNAATTSATADIRGINLNSGLDTVKNNIVRLGTDITSGIQITGIVDAGLSSNSAVLFNSVYIGGASVTAELGNTIAFKSDVLTNVRTYQNNIFVNARSNAAAGGKHYAIRVAGTTANPAGLSLNYNIYQSTGTGGVFGFFNSLDVASFASWKSGVGQDANSYNSDPKYIDPSNATTPDLHINTTVGSAAEGSGVDFAAITNDYDGQTRSGLTPVDIGADAFNGLSATPVINTVTANLPTGQCTVADRIITANITPSNPLTSVTLNYSFNGVAQTPISMTGGNTTATSSWTATLPHPTAPVNATVAYFVTASDGTLSTSKSGTTYSDEPLLGLTAIAVASASTICAGQPTVLTASLTPTYYTNNFESGVAAFATSAVTGTPSLTANTTYFSEGASSMYFNTASTSADVSASNTSNINLSGTSTAVLTFSHIAAMEGPSTSYDYGYVQYSADGGTTWTSFPTTSYAGSGTIFNSVVSFSTKSYANWISAFTGTTSAPTNALWQNEVINIPAAALTSQFRIRFRYTTDGSSNYFGWFIDNVKVTASVAPAISSVTWDNGGGAGNPLTVNPVSNVTYTGAVTASGCTLTSNSLPITVNPLTATPTNATTTPQCGIPTYTITTAVSSPTVKWYAGPSTTTPLSTGSSLSYVHTGYTGGGATNTLYVTVTDATGCESARLPIAVVVNDPLPLTISPTGTATACVGEIKQIDVTSSLGNFDTYIWSPSTNLYTDAAGTNPYNGVDPIYTTIYYKRSSATASEAISLNASGGGCTASALVTYSVSAYPVITSVSVTPATICSGNTVNLAGTIIAAAPGGTATLGTATTLTGTIEELTAFCNYRASYRMQLLFTGAELTAAGLQAGNITNVKFNITTLGDASNNTAYTVKMGTTGLTALTDYVSSSSFTTVFPAATYTHAIGVNTIPFSTPFNWDGTSNIILEVSHNGVDLYANAQTYYTATVDNTVAYGYNGATTATISTKRLNVVFTGVALTNTASSYVWNWSTTLGAPSITAGATTTHAPVNAAPSAVTGTYSATASINGCASAPLTTTSITVNPLAVAPSAQPASPTLTPSSTSVSIAFSNATGNPDGYLVVRAATQPTDPQTGIVYTAGATALGGTIVASGLPPFADNGLSTGNSYTYWVYSYNGTTLCGGPVYLVSSPATATTSTCAAVPVASAATSISTTGFTANWAAVSSATGYELDISTSPTFASFLPGYNAFAVAGGSTISETISGLSNLTAYYYRVRSTSGSCISPNSSTISLSTFGNVPWSESFDALPAVGGTSSGTGTNLPTGWISNSSQWSTTNATSYNTPYSGANYLRFAWSSTNVDVWTPGLQLTGGITYTVSYRAAGDGYTGWTSDLLWNSTQSLTGATQLGATYVPADNGSVATIMPYVLVTRSFTPATSGIYYFGIRGNQASGLPWYMSFDDISVKTPCTAPTTQPTVLNLATGSAAINGSFTAAAAPGATGYLVLRTPTGVAPSVTPVDATYYSTVGATLGNATVVSSGTGTSFISSGLTTLTGYRYTVYSFNGDCGGEPLYNSASPLFAEATTTGAQSYTSVTTGLWSDPATWGMPVIPSSLDDVTIGAATTVTIDIAAVANTLVVDGTLQYEATTARTLTVTSDVTVNSNGMLRNAVTGTQTGHQLSLGGNLTKNDGGNIEFNFNTGGAGITFTGATNNTFATGSAGDLDVAHLRSITINKGTANSNILEITGANPNFTVPAGFLTLTNGTFKVSRDLGSNTFFSTAAYTIPATAGLWLNDAATTVTAQNASATNNGLLRITAGSMNVGTAAANNLVSGTGATYNIEGGALSVAGSFTSSNAISYSQSSGGVVSVSTQGASTAPSFGFTSTAVANSFTMSGGTITIVKPNTAGTPNDYNQAGGTVAITGGTVQFGNTSTLAASTFVVSVGTSANPINFPSVVVDGTTNTKVLSVAGSGTGNIKIQGNLTIATGSSLVHNNTGGQTISLLGNGAGTPGNLINNGTITLGASGSANNRFNFADTTYTTAQTYTGTGDWGTATVAYPGIGILNSNGVVLSQTGTPIITSRVNLFSGAVTNPGNITLGVGATSSATVQRGGDATRNAGSFNVSAPNFNYGTGGLNLVYSTALGAVTTGTEVPSARTVSVVNVSNTNGVTVADGDLSTTSLTLNGVVNTDASNVLRVTGTAVSDITRTSGWINGPMSATLPASLVTGSTYILPVGKTAYAGIDLVNPTTTAGGNVVIDAEYFAGASGGSPINAMIGLYSGYWTTNVTGASTVTTTLRVNSPVAINVGTDALSKSDGGLTGNYDLIGTTAITTSSVTSDAPQFDLNASQPDYFAIGLKAVPMTYVSSTTTQTAGTTYVYTNYTNQKVIGVEVVTANNFPALTMSAMTFTLNGSTMGNIDNNVGTVKLWYTGNSNTFAATTQVGAQADPPYGSPFTINPGTDLLPGTNYFWLTVDVAGSAVNGDLIDAECTSMDITENVTSSTATYSPTIGSPAGSSVIKTYLSGDYSIGTGNISGEAGHFATLTAAVTSLTDVGVSGPVRFLLTDAAYSSTTGETFPIVIGQYANASATNTVTILPNTGVNATMTATLANAATSVIKLNGADYVTIDGSNNGTNSRNLTISNLNTSTSSAVIWLASATATDGATNNVIKNTVVSGASSTTTFAGIFSGRTASIALAGNALVSNSSNTIQNNRVIKAQYGIYAIGTSTTALQTGLVITQNEVGTATAGEGFSIGAIDIRLQTGAVVSNNTVQNVKGTGTTNMIGINVVDSKISSISTNQVFGMNYSGTSTTKVYGISTSTSTFSVVGNQSSNTYSNNVVYDLVSSGTSSSWNTSGINNNGGYNDKYYFNTVHLAGQMSGSGGSAGSAAFSNGNGITSTNCPVIDLRNNIFSMAGTSVAAAPLYAHYTTVTTYSTSTISNNNLYSVATAPATSVLGRFNSTNYTSLTAWQTATTKDANSKNVLAVFQSATNYHLVAASNAALAGAGIAGTGITVDMDGETRVAPPTIGADELVPCAGAIGGTATASVAASYCGTSPAITITASGYSSALNGSYQWQSSTTSGSGFTDISGATYPSSYTTSPVNITTYYRLRVTCTTGAAEDFSNEIEVAIIASPSSLISSTGGTVFCTPTPGSIALSGTTDLVSPAPEYQWRLDGVDISGANTSSYSVPSGVTGSYTLAVTNTSTACTGVSTPIIISTTPRPLSPVITPTTTAICTGSNVTLVASGGNTTTGGELILGTGTATSSPTTTSSALGPNPFQSFYGGAKQQMIIRASELTDLGLAAGSSINSIGFTLATAEARTLYEYVVKMQHTALNQFANTSFVTSGFTVVRNAADFDPVEGLNTIPFNTDFTWNGTSNLLIEVNFSNADGGGSGTNTAVYSTTSFASTLFYRVDNNTAAFVDAAATATASYSSRNNLVIGYSLVQTPTWSWTASPDLNTTTGTTVIATPVAPSNVYTAIATNAAGCTRSATATVTVNPLPSITTAAAATGVFRLGNIQTTPLTYSATSETPTTYSIVWDAAALSAGFANVTDATLPASPILVSVAANTDAGTYNGSVSVKNGNGCASLTTSAFTLTVTNANPVWTGNTSTNWNIGSNWSTGVVPAGTESITIDAPRPNYPVLTTNIAIGGTLDLAPGSKITIGGNTLTVTGGIANNTGVLVGSNTSNLTLGATSSVRFSAALGENFVKNLNVNAGTATLATALNITGGTGLANSNTFGTVTVANGASIVSNGNLTFKSNASGTARLAAGATSGQWIVGDVTVERYIPANDKRAWRMLSVPTKGSQTINGAWQEGVIGATLNPKPGFGTLISTNLTNYTALTAVGFDAFSTSTSLRTYNSAANAWVNASTTIGAGGIIQSVKGYSLYIRGDRSVPVASTITGSGATTLRTKGVLYTGDQSPLAVAANKFEMVGNLYPSAIDFTLLSKPGILGTFYIWDPKAGGSTALGAYQTFNPLNGYLPLIPGSYGAGTVSDPFRANKNIESGQAFFVTAGAAGGTIAMVEAAKVAGDGINVFRPTSGIAKMKVNLYSVASDNTLTLADANLSAFDNAFSNTVDGDDATKLANSGENFAILRDSRNLVIEARNSVVTTDTTYFKMWNMNAARPYRLELIATDMNVPGLTAFLVDGFTNSSTPLNLTGTTNYDFNLTTASGSIAPDRFKVVYRQADFSPLPVSFVSIGANKIGAVVKVDWKVSTERGIRSYDVERSADGTNFAKIGNVAAVGNSSAELSYNSIDATPLTGTNFYRIKTIGVGGDSKYSYIVKVLIGNVKAGYTISPNPVEGGIVNLQFKNQPQGRYNVRLLSVNGEVMFTKSVEHTGGNSTQLLTLPTLIARGAYQIEIIAPDKAREVQNLFINTTN